MIKINKNNIESINVGTAIYYNSNAKEYNSNVKERAYKIIRIEKEKEENIYYRECIYSNDDKSGPVISSKSLITYDYYILDDEETFYYKKYMKFKWYLKKNDLVRVKFCKKIMFGKIISPLIGYSGYMDVLIIIDSNNKTNYNFPCAISECTLATEEDIDYINKVLIFG